MKYYARRSRNGDWLNDAVMSGPFATYDEAAKANADFLAFNAIPMEHRPDMQVLVDLTGFDCTSEEETQRVLMTDPALRAVFELGRRMGHRDINQKL